MNGAASWVGPAIVAAVISALVTGLGWLVSERQAFRREARLRRERVGDMQAALLAEIRAGRIRLDDLRTQSAIVSDTINSDPSYTPFIPREIEPIIFRSLVGDIYLLPTSVIDPVVLYYQQGDAIAYLVQDMATERYAGLDAARKVAIYRDYTALLGHRVVLGREAAEAIAGSLNIRLDEAWSDRRSDGDPGEVLERTP